MLSVIIPAYREAFLQKTIDDILKRATGKIEVIVCLDGYWPDPPLKNDVRVKIIHHSDSKGMRHSINSAANMATGKHLMKCDAHCLFDKAFDQKLIDASEPDLTQVPVRYSLDSVKWARKKDKKYEFEYIASDDLKGKRWPEYADRVKGQDLPYLMTFQGSCWFMEKDRFFALGGLDEVNYGSMGREAQEVCLKSWLSGGKCVLNRRTWYAHLSKSKTQINFSRRKEKEKSTIFANDFWKNNRWPLKCRNLTWLVAQFHPVPTWDKEKLFPALPTITEKLDHMIKLIDNSAGKNLDDFKKLTVKGMNRAGLYRFFADSGLKSGAEVGVQRGRNAMVLFQTIPDLELILVDPYTDHPSCPKKWGQKNHDKFRKMAHKRFVGTEFENQTTWMETYSELAANEIPDGALDFVYIDGDHSYGFVMIDLILWTRKVRKGGIVSGHDFKLVGVHRALKDFTKAFNIKNIQITDKEAQSDKGDKNASWFFVKE